MRALSFITCMLFNYSCAHVPKPATFGFDSVQCVQVRQVVCMPDADYPEATCVRDMSAAIEEVNAAVGRTIFHFNGVIAPNKLSDAVASGTLVVIGFDDAHLPAPNVLALTVPRVRLDTDLGLPCITQVMIGVSPTIAGLRGPSSINASFVLAHELVHALGADHAPDGWFQSRMEAVNNSSLDHCFTSADIRTLRNVYGF